MYRGNNWSLKIPTEPDPKARSIAQLDAYAMERWECVLHFMVNQHQPQDKTKNISYDATQILEHSGLMKKWGLKHHIFWFSNFIYIFFIMYFLNF